MANDSPLKILVVDDEPVVRDFMRNLAAFIDKNSQVSALADGFEAMELAKKEAFDLVFLDVRMPKIDGLDLLRELKKINSRSSYVMITGYAVDDMLAEAHKEGILSALKKPFDVAQITALIEQARLQKG